MSEKKKSYGKEFERQVYKNFSEIENVSIDRIPDQVTRYRGSSSNICDFIVYRKPNMIYLECKTVHGTTLPFSNIRENQWQGLLEKSKIDGVIAGVMCWWVDKDLTEFLSIEMLQTMKENGAKSVSYKLLACNGYSPIIVDGKKKRTMFEYDMKDFLEKLKNNA